jgi:hypothetical protein
MLILASLELVVLALLALLYYRTIHEDRAERRQLLDRIQRPDLLPRDRPVDLAPVEPETDESNLIGLVQFPSEDPAA